MRKSRGVEAKVPLVQVERIRQVAMEVLCKVGCPLMMRI